MNFCFNCGSSVEPNTKFCANCGADLSAPANTARMQPDPPITPSSVPRVENPQSTYQEVTSLEKQPQYREAMKKRLQP